MTFEQARAIAIRLGAQTPLYDHAHPTAQCWIDRIAWANEVAQRPGAIATCATLARAVTEANRYAGVQKLSTMFRDHDCWKCESGALTCIVGNPHQCEYPHAKND